MADDLVREVNEAMRADRTAAFWKKQQGLIIGIVLAIVLAAAAHSIWQSMRESHGGEVMLQLSDNQRLLAAGKAEEAAAGFGEVVKATSGELKALASIWQARALIVAQKTDEAIAVLTPVSNDGNLWSDIACLRLAGLSAKNATCLSTKKGSPLASERAQWAAAQAWENGEKDAAIASITALIADKNTSQESRVELQQWLGVMKAQQSKN